MQPMSVRLAAQLKVMAPRGSGAIVNTASIAGVVGLVSAAAYSASKHGVIGLTRSAAIDYGSDNIRVNALCPGVIDTPLVRLHGGAKSDLLKKRTPLGRFGSPREIAELVVCLCSDRASFVTGAVYTADGGFTAP